jgi:threonine aldolase
MVEPMPTPRGVLSAQDIEEAVRRLLTVPAPYGVAPCLLCVEQTHNFGGGSVWSLAELKTAAERARHYGLAIHMDGARLMNAVIASGTSAAQFAKCVDSVWIDFTKGLGAPMGAVLAGSRDFIRDATVQKHILGGALRQAGIVAAGCLYALDNHVDRLKEDHDNAKRLAAGLAGIRGIRVRNDPPESNMVFFDVGQTGIEANAFLANLGDRGVEMGHVGSHIRAVTHLDVSAEDIETTLRIIEEIV